MAERARGRTRQINYRVKQPQDPSVRIRSEAFTGSCALCVTLRFPRRPLVGPSVAGIGVREGGWMGAIGGREKRIATHRWRFSTCGIPLWGIVSAVWWLAHDGSLRPLDRAGITITKSRSILQNCFGARPSQKVVISFHSPSLSAGRLRPCAAGPSTAPLQRQVSLLPHLSPLSSWS